MGDSTLRYLYLTAVELCAKHSLTPWGGCKTRCFFNERTWRSTPNQSAWDAFFVGTSSGGFCDCHRGRGSFDLPHTTENRYHEACAGSRLSFLLAYRPQDGMRGTWWPGQPDSLRRGPYPSYRPAWTLGFEKAALDFVRALKPSVVVLNVGHHLFPLRHAQGYDEAAVLALYRRLRDALAPTGVRVVWVSTIQQRDELPMYDEAALAGRVWPEVFNTSEATARYGRHAFWDGSMHLQLPGNVELATGLLAQLYPARAHALPPRAAAVLSHEPT